MEEERRLLRRLLEQDGLGSASDVTTDDGAHERLPLSYGQQLMWFQHRLQPGNNFHNVVVRFGLNGNLDVAALERSLQEIVRRHGGLRTHLVVEDGKPMQKIELTMETHLRQIDLRDQQPAESRRRQAEEIIATEGAKPFDLERGPMWRGVLLRVEEREFILGLSLHHIIVDEWSLEIWRHEMGTLYAAYVQREQSPLIEMPVQYADYTLWQAEWLKGDACVRQMGYWKKQLAGMPEILELPTDKPRPPMPQQRTRLVSRTVRTELWEALRQLGRLEGATLFMTLLAAYQVLLLRYTGQQDFGVGTPVANRNHVQAEGVIGYCVNMLVLRAHLEGKSSFRDALKGVREAALEGFAHQELPLEKLIEELSPKRRLSHTPLFQVIFTLWNDVTWNTKFDGVEFDLSVVSPGVMCDLALTATKYEIPKLELHYAADLFEATTIERMLGHFERLLEAVAACPELKLRDIPLLTESEIKQVEQWNQTRREYPQKGIAELFAEQAERHGQEIAVVLGQEKLRYSELDRRSNQLGHYLTTLGVGPETLVGISMERSPEMIVALLGIVKAGAAYVPLDPTYPPDRLRYMVESAGLEVVLTKEHFARQLAGMNTRLIFLDRDWKDIGKSSERRFDSGATAENLAYMIYTSGSTGSPKGIGVTHRNVVRLVCNTDYLQVRGGDIVAQTSNSSFDVITFEIWAPLLNGARIVIVSNDVLLDSRKLKVELEQQGVQILFLITALFNGYAKRHPETFDSVEQVLFGGEAANSAATAALLKHRDNVRLMNLYGPAECTTFSTWHAVNAGDCERASIPIGVSVATNRTYVLDGEMNLAPVGVVGELYVGGDGVARGYWRRPGLTAEKFVPNPFSKAEGKRLYRTGDLARWLPDGKLEFFGRVDHQVKIRGFRVELGEIEAVLQQQSGVRECAVLVKPGADGSKRLIAYVAGARAAEDLLQDLKRKLPEYMVPSLIVNLPDLPLTANGKVNREALLEIETAPETGTEHAAPRTAVEERLVKIWTAVLEINTVGINDNFFDVGGHSLLAILAANKVQTEFGINVPVRVIFESPTIAELASVVELSLQNQEPLGRELSGNQKTRETSESSSGPKSSDYPLSYAQEQLWFLDRLQPDSNYYNVPMAWRIKGELDVHRLERCIQEIIRRHEVLRTHFVMDESEKPRQKIAADKFDFQFTFADLTVLEPAEREAQARKILADAGAQPFDLGRLPLIRGVLVKLGEKEHILELTLHHIVCDEWSFEVLLRELGILYEAYGNGKESPLPELEFQYGDYSTNQRQEQRAGKFAEQLEYWRAQLSGMPGVLELATDLPRPAIQTFKGRILRRPLRRELLDSLNAVGRREGATLFMTLLAAYQVLLMRYTGQDDFAVGTVLTNRNRTEVQDLIGYFLNTLVMRANLRGAPSFREALGRVRDAALGAYAHQDLPFEKLVEELAPDRDVSRTPIFQVMFTLRSTPNSGINVGGLELAEEAVELDSAKCDLVLYVDVAKGDATVGFNYSTDLFEPETIHRMLDHYERLLEGIVADAEQQVWTLPMMRELDRKIIADWNGANRIASEETIISFIEAEADTGTEKTAAVFGQKELSFPELNRRANQIGHYLRNLGLARESRVGIFMGYSPEMVAAVLGVMKAGAAYVPLDVENPRERLRCVIDSAGINLLLTVDVLGKRLPQVDIRVVRLDSEWEVVAQQSTANPELRIPAAGLACVIYTSVCGQRAKGLMIEHGGLLNRLSGPRWPEIWPQLTSSSMVTSSAFFSPSHDGLRSSAKPNRKAAVYLLDPHLHPVAIGMPGEIWLDEPGSRGYLGQPALTAEKFVPDPFRAESGARMRSSGERARYRDDGSIEFLGRLDAEVRIEGIPIDLEEIEALLESHESVRQAVVVVRNGGNDGSRLVAYAVAREGKKVSQSDLRAYILEQLPSFMAPSVFIPLRELPRNAKGEVDRAALSALGEQSAITDRVLPRTALEQTIAAAWQTVLGVNEVGIHDSFFDRGGHSLLLIRLHQKLRAALSLDIELLHLFQFPTIDSLVRFLQAGYNFDGKSHGMRERAGRQKIAVQKLRRMHTQWTETHLTE